MFERRIARSAAWAVLIFVAFATLSPFVMRPRLTEDEPTLIVSLERFGAFFALGFLFAVGYAERIRTVSLMILTSAVFLEVAQLLVPGRHAEFSDLVEKIAGAVLGLAIGRFAIPFLPKVTRVVTYMGRHWLKVESIDGEVAELLVGLSLLLLFAVSLVLFQNMSW